MRPPRTALVVGAGIGGLAAAAALARHGIPTSVLERAPALTEVGAGLQITPNGARVLAALGLGPALDAASVAAEAIEPHDALAGRRIARFPLAGQGPYRFVHRADLLGLLAGAARDAGVAIRTGAAVLRAVPGGVALEDGSTLAADLVVGADGLRSVVRPALDGERPAFFTGQVAWRAVVNGGHPPVARIWMAPGRHAVTYPLPGGRVNLVAVREEAAWAAEGWNHPDDPDALRGAFADAGGDLSRILAAVERTARWGLFRHPVAATWSGDGRAILGDAAHPTLPFLAQGANLALEDAWVLARLAAGGRLAEYGALRRPRVARAIAAANANARNYHLRSPSRRAAHLALGLLGAAAPGLLIGRLDWLYGFDATA